MRCQIIRFSFIPQGGEYSNQTLYKYNSIALPLHQLFRPSILSWIFLYVCVNCEVSSINNGTGVPVYCTSLQPDDGFLQNPKDVAFASLYPIHIVFDGCSLVVTVLC
jgi:hypothetical protein